MDIILWPSKEFVFNDARENIKLYEKEKLVRVDT